MRLNVGTDYGLRVLMYLLAEPGERAQVDRMAETFAVSANHLNKVVQRLAHAGFVETYRGRSGGVALARSPADINLGDVVRSLEADFAVVECFLEGDAACCLTPACRLRGLMREALTAFIDTLSRYNLADLDAPDLKRLLAASVVQGAAKWQAGRRS